ncbi:hypothetical protein D3C81_2040270 [compost metagenome]
MCTKVQEFAGNQAPSAAVEAYIQKHHTDLVDGKATDRNAAGRLSDRALNDAANGIRAADGVQLNHGVGGSETLALT